MRAYPKLPKSILSRRRRAPSFLAFFWRAHDPVGSRLSVHETNSGSAETPDELEGNAAPDADDIPRWSTPSQLY